MRRKEEETGISAVSSEGKKHSHAKRLERRREGLQESGERERMRGTVLSQEQQERRKKEEVILHEAQELHQVKDKRHQGKRNNVNDRYKILRGRNLKACLLNILS